MSYRKLIPAAALVLGLCAMGAGLLPHYFWPDPVPVDRIVENIEAHLEEHPDDALAHFNLARAHSLAFRMRTNALRAWEDQRDGGYLNPASEWMQLDARFRDVEIKVFGPNEVEDPKEIERLTVHLREGIKHFDRAIDLKPDGAKQHLGLAYLLDSGAAWRSVVRVIPPNALPSRQEVFEHYTPARILEMLQRPSVDDPFASDNVDWIETLIRHQMLGEFVDGSSRNVIVQVLMDFEKKGADPEGQPLDPSLKAKISELLDLDWHEQTIERYFRSYSLALPEESKMSSRMMGEPAAEFLIVLEAGDAIVRLIDERGERPEDTVRLASIKATKQAIDELPRNSIITPIIFSLNTPAPLESLLAPETIVNFDLDGTGREQSWPWVSPETSILVWDPEETGEVTSGRQLFGSVTWWLFFDDGYRAMDALDDNRDGELSGDELVGLAVWTDANSNGVSDPGEVVPIAETGIEAISCRQTGTAMGMPANTAGLRMKGGRVLPTYDWVAAEVQPEAKKPVGDGGLR